MAEAGAEAWVLDAGACAGPGPALGTVVGYGPPTLSDPGLAVLLVGVVEVVTGGPPGPSASVPGAGWAWGGVAKKSQQKVALRSEKMQHILV